MWYAYIISFVFAALVGAVLIKRVVDALWDGLVPNGSTNCHINPHPYQGEALGVVERAFYVTALRCGLSQLVGVWLILKALGQWKRWGEVGDARTGKPDGGSLYMIFLIENALSLLYGFTGFKLVDWILMQRYLRISWVVAGLIGMTLAAWVWLRRYQKSA